MEWYIFSLLALGFYTIQDILLKIAADKKCDENLTTFYFLLTVAVISIPILIIKGISFTTTLGIIAALVNGIFFAVLLVTKISSLKLIPASIVYPIVRLNIVVVILLFILFLNERVTLQNVLAIILAMIALYLLSKGGKE